MTRRLARQDVSEDFARSPEGFGPLRRDETSGKYFHGDLEDREFVVIPEPFVDGTRGGIVTLTGWNTYECTCLSADEFCGHSAHRADERDGRIYACLGHDVIGPELAGED